MKICKFEGCEKKHNSKGYCQGHYTQLTRGKELTAIVRKGPVEGLVCSVEFCTVYVSNYWSSQYCNPHYRQHKIGKPFTVISTRREAKDIAMVDGRYQCNQCLEWKYPECYTESGKHSKRPVQPNCRECCQWNQIYRLYTLTKDQYLGLLDSQGGCCAICKTTQPLLTKETKWFVDHDHRCCPGRKTCGKCIRGLLCRDCNSMLGYSKDNQDTLNAGVSYLQQPPARKILGGKNDKGQRK